MQTIQKILLISAISLMLPLAASAQTIQDVQAMSPEDRRAYMEAMSDDERAAMREKWRGEFDSMSDEEKQAVREKRRSGHRADRKARWDSMSEEERAAAREKRGERKGTRDKPRRGHGDRRDRQQEPEA